MEGLLKAVRELAPPAVWSAGVELSRNSEVQEVPSAIEDERSFRIIQRPKDPLVGVSLSESNEAWQSDCACEDDPCKHVIAAILAVRQERIVTGPVKRAGGSTGFVVHSFSRVEGRLSFARYLSWGESRREIPGSLAAALKAIRPGEPTVAVSREEEQIDHVLPSQKNGVLDPRTMRMLLAALSRLPHVELDGALVSVSATPLPCSLEVTDDEGGFRIRCERDVDVSEVFQNGAAMHSGSLCAIADSALSADEWNAFRGNGTWYSSDEGRELASVFIPALEGRISVVIKSERLPRGVRVAPKIVIETVGDAAGGTLTAIPHLVYGEPPFAEVRGERIEVRHGDLVPVRDRIEESRLVREVQTRLFLRLNEAKVFTGEAAINFTKMLKGWEVQGDGTALFTPAKGLQPRIAGDAIGVSLMFETTDGRRATSEAIAEAWRGGGSFVRLDDGG